MRARKFVSVKRRTRRIDLAVLFATAINLCFLLTVAAGETFTGQAVNLKGGLEYVEYHTVEYKNGEVSRSETIYYDPNQQKIGELISEYSHGPQFGSYDFRDIRAQYEDGAEVKIDQIRLFRKEGPDNHVDAKILPKKPDQIVGQGFHQFIVHNLEPIAQGEILHVRLVFPSRLDQFKFRIRKRKIEGDTLYIRLEIDNWFLRLFAPHVDAEYDLRTRRLLRYVGISNLEDVSGKHKKVTITYSYKS
ncbi:MAG: hypothetical protein JSU72_01470 [Deltaproteobacteria bacterium]|nr:MAG: hypothetical protein JSU72_01470 [Deltaproteobacteria bacterium]